VKGGTAVTLGILVNTDRHPDHVVGIVRAALVRGHSVFVFVMDDGTRLLHHARLPRLVTLPEVKMSCCLQSAKKRKIDTSGLPPEIVEGSQLNNAFMHREADRVIVLKKEIS